jgi:formyltetrahydrofolate synthetase
MISKNLLLCIVLLVQTATSDAQTIEIWGKGEVPRITDTKHVPRTIDEIWKDYNRSYDKNNPLEVKIHKT